MYTLFFLHIIENKKVYRNYEYLSKRGRIQTFYFFLNVYFRLTHQGNYRYSAISSLFDLKKILYKVFPCKAVISSSAQIYVFFITATDKNLV